MASGTGIERIKTGIKGIDSMLNGGVPEKNQVIIAGGPGSGKTLLSFEIIYRCAKAGIPSAYIAFEEQPAQLIRNAKSAFGGFADVDSLMQQGNMVVGGEELAARMEDTTGSTETYSFGNVVSYIEDIVMTNKAKVIALDSISLFRLVLSSDGFIYRKSIAQLISNLRRLDVTSFITLETPYTEKNDVRYSPEFFLFDGVISMYQTGDNEKRSFVLEVLKMRGTDHSMFFAPYHITQDGFEVQTLD
jgi:KaiC/GvpD/RAD55 family RecA-like ATPase